MIKLKLISMALLCVGLFGACQNDDIVPEDKPKGAVFTVVKSGGNTGGGLSNMIIASYAGDAVQYKAVDVTPGDGGRYPVMEVNALTDKFAFLAGEYPEEVTTKLDAFPELAAYVTPVVDYVTTFPSLSYSAVLNTEELDLNSVIDVQMQVAVAALDVDILTERNLVIDSCVVSGLTDRTGLLKNNTYAEGNASLQFAKRDFETPLTTSYEAVVYMYEQRDARVTVKFYARLDGIKQVFTAVLPSHIERNKRYTVEIDSDGAKVVTDISVKPWEDGGSTPARPDVPEFLIDVEGSELPAGSRVALTRDTLFVDALFEGELRLSFIADVQTDTKVEGDIVTVVRGDDTGGEYINNDYVLSFERADVGHAEQRVKMFIKPSSDAHYYAQEHIVIVQHAYRTQFKDLDTSGAIAHNTITYADYIDGSLGEISSNYEIASVATASVDAQFNWIRMDPDTGNNAVYAIEGGFKPNDVEAEGQQQTSRIVVTYRDGVQENFTISRIRRSLPVVKIGSDYWMKYNLRGHMNRYEDQVGFDEDEADLWEYLKTCSSDDFVRLAGSGYKGVRKDSMTLVANSGATNLAYAEYNSWANGDLCKANVKSVAPVGFQMPVRSHYNRLIANGLTLPAVGAVSNYTTAEGNRRMSLERFVRDDLTIRGVDVGNMVFAKLSNADDSDYFIMTGIGHQWSNTGFQQGHMVYAFSDTGTTYAELVNSTNRIGFSPQNAAKSKMLRCVKTPVNYVVEP